ncbi:MAG: hypothetical protein E6Q30_05455 [Aquabacterium sp.]|nr:MAG: hypothetical protein E6Q30_05455 [Aquabacterium sp.]
MTVHDLLSLLAKLPPDLPVFVEGYESGWDPLIAVEEGQVLPIPQVEEWDGEVDRAQTSSTQPSTAIFLVGRRGHRRHKQMDPSSST